jgi:general secretion pathway protein C
MAAVPEKSAASALGTSLVVALVLLLAWQLAYWTWNFAARPSAGARAPAPASAVDLDLVARLFGGDRSAASTSAASGSGLRLKGVVAPTPGTTAAAIFARPGGKDLAVFIDGEAQPGVRLLEVHPDHVVVARAGVRERVDLDTARGTQAAAAPGARVGPGFRVNVARSGNNTFSFARKELDEALRDPNQLNYLGQIGVASGGGVRMEAAPAGSLASKLGLQPGDVIRRINGQAVASPGDLARVYQQFATTSSVNADVERAGTIVQLSYRIQ